MKIEIKTDKLHDALAAWLKEHRPRAWSKAKGKDARLYVVVKKGALHAVGFEVDE